MSKKNDTIPKGYKPSPLGPIPNDWEVTELAKLFELKNGINAGKESYGSGVKFINVMEVIYNDRITPDIIPGSVNISADQKELYLVKNGDVLFNRTSETTGEIGLTAVYEGQQEVVFGGFVIRARPINKSLVNIFKRYCFHSKIVRDQIITRGQGAVRSNIGQGDLEKVCVPIPPLKEQTAIANLLSTWDKAINTLTQLIAQKEQRKKWLMQQLLTGKKRLKGFKGEWREVKLGEIFEEISEINDGGDLHSVMTISSRQGFISQTEKFDRIIAGDSLQKYTQLRKNDFAYNKGNSKSYPMGCIYQLEDHKTALVPFVYICFRSVKGIDSKFYKHWFLAHGLDRQLKRIISSGARGDGLLNVNSHDFFQLKIPHPSREEQSAISTVMESADTELNLLKMRLDKLKNQKKGLMQILLTGKKRIRY